MPPKDSIAIPATEKDLRTGIILQVTASDKTKQKWKKTFTARSESSLTKSSAVLKPSWNCILVGSLDLVALSNSDGRILWILRPDPSGCYGVFSSPGEDSIIVHGELAFYNISCDGQLKWVAPGNDIFVYPARFTQNEIRVKDFKGKKYRIRTSDGTVRT